MKCEMIPLSKNKLTRKFFNLNFETLLVIVLTSVQFFISGCKTDNNDATKRKYDLLKGEKSEK